jgi:hypothetical protein
MAEPALKLLLVAAALAALACMTRYIGVTVILTGAILIVLNRRVGFGRRMASAAAFCGIAALPLAGWLARNWLLTGTLAGERFPSSLSLLENVSMAGASVLDFFFSTPRVLPAPLGVTIFGLFAAVLFAPALFMHYRQEEGERERTVPLMMVWVTFIAVYIAAIIASAALVSMDTIGGRLLLPIYAPLVIYLLLAAKALFDRRRRAELQAPKPSRIALGRVLCVCVGLWLAGSAYRTFTYVYRKMEKGPGGLTGHRWQESQIITYLRTRRLQGQVFSNNPVAVCFLTDHVARFSPRRHMREVGGEGSRSGLEQFRARLADAGGAYLVWFDASAKKYLYGTEDLREVAAMRELADLSDGSIYSLRAKPSPDKAE